MEMIDPLKRKMVKSGLATLAVGGLIGTSVLSTPKKAMAQCETCYSCNTCPTTCSSCSTCETCQVGKSEAQI